MGDRVTAVFGERDWDALHELFAGDVTIEDRRPGLRNELVGRDAVVENLQQLAAVGGVRWTDELLATRGDRLALYRRSLVAENEAEVEILDLMATDDDGRIVLGVHFEVEDTAAALAELDTLFVAGEGAPFADILALTAEQRRALQSGDWDAYRKVIHDDVVLVDHRPVSLGEVRGADQVIASTRAFFDLVHDRHTRILAIHAIAPDKVLAEQIGTGRSDDGGEIESHLIRLQLVREGRVSRIELFPGDEVPAALQRFQEI